MDIRYGFDIAVDFAQPTTFLTMMDVHSDFRGGIAGETALGLEPRIPAERFVDECGNVVRRLSAPAGAVALRLQGVFRTDGARMTLIRRRKPRRCLTCRPTRCLFSDRADIARRSSCRISPGRILGGRRRVGQSAGDLRLCK